MDDPQFLISLFLTFGIWGLLGWIGFKLLGLLGAVDLVASQVARWVAVLSFTGLAGYLFFAKYNEWFGLAALLIAAIVLVSDKYLKK